jgi:hypothetical protein
MIHGSLSRPGHVPSSALKAFYRLARWVWEDPLRGLGRLDLLRFEVLKLRSCFQHHQFIGVNYYV